MDLLYGLLQREVIVATAIIGAILVMVGNARAAKEAAAKNGRLLVRVGYGITGASVALFILAGFLGA